MTTSPFVARWMFKFAGFAAVTAIALSGGPATSAAAGEFSVRPAEVSLAGNHARAQLVVTAAGEDDHAADLTHGARFESLTPGTIAVSTSGQINAVGNGQGVVRVSVEGQPAQEIPVKVEGIVEPAKIDFDLQVRPLLSKAGCNAGACHASQYGKGGFKLSVFGFQPSADRTAIVRDRRGRRVDFLHPEESLLLRKPTLAVPHGGSKRLTKGSVDYRLLVDWLSSGAPAPRSDAPTVTAMEVFPKRRVGDLGFRQQLQVVANYSDGGSRDVTCWARFDSMDDAVCNVSPEGVVTTIGRGQAPVLVRFEGQAEISMVVVPFGGDAKLADWKSNNFVDELAAAKFRELGIVPSPLCSDSTFIRRAFLDAAGKLPTVDQTRAFLADKSKDKRAKLVDQLLGLTGDPKLDIHNDEYAALWTLRWSDLIRNNSNKLGEQGMWSLHNWIKEAFRSGKPFDQFVSELITAKGSIYMSGPANYYRVASTPQDLAESTAQLFLGVRLQCAKCHHHPFEEISQGDYYGFAAFFARVGTKNSQEFGLFGRESVVMVRSSGEVRHPKTGKNLPPTPLFGEPVNHDLDRRIPLATWLTSANNEMFAANIVNRYVDFLLGRPLVTPVDDMRDTNPASNKELMQALTKSFAENKFNLKQLIRTIMTSRLYQLSSQPTAQNRPDRRFYSFFKVKRLQAEVLLDAIDDVTGTQTKFKNLPLGTRATELPDAEYPNYFLTTFAKPRRASVCECERPRDENLAQAMHLLNGDTLATKIADGKGRVAQLLAAKTPHDTFVEELYLTALSRLPSDAEKQACQKLLAESPSPQEFYSDLLWALVNSKSFLFVE